MMESRERKNKMLKTTEIMLLIFVPLGAGIIAAAGVWFIGSVIIKKKNRK